MNDGDVATVGVDPLTHFKCNTFFCKHSHKIPNLQCPSGAFAFLVSPLSSVGLFSFKEKQDCFGGRCYGIEPIALRKGLIGTITGGVSFGNIFWIILGRWWFQLTSYSFIKHGSWSEDPLIAWTLLSSPTLWGYPWVVHFKKSWAILHYKSSFDAKKKDE